MSKQISFAAKLILFLESKKISQYQLFTDIFVSNKKILHQCDLLVTIYNYDNKYIFMVASEKTEYVIY